MSPRALGLLAAALLLVAGCSGDGTIVPDPSSDAGLLDLWRGTNPTTCDVAFPDRTVGLTLCRPGSSDGYVLWPAKHTGDVYLIDRLGRAVHHWGKSRYEPGQSCYLRDNGNLVRAAMLVGASNIGGGEGGRIEEYDWNDQLVWSFNFASNQAVTHHDFKILPNGNLLMLAVERKTMAEAVGVGFDGARLNDGYVAPELLIEVQRDGDGFKVVWEWHVWDHLVQGSNKGLANYGDPKAHPELLNVQGGAPAFWNHANAVAYNPALDQIAISARSHNEIWVIDHSTTSAEAKAHAGGKRGKGGDFLYRWGNPQTYLAGSASDRTLFNQHDIQWIDPGLPGAGHFLVFNNGLDRPGAAGFYSSLDEWVSPVLADGSYAVPAPGSAFGPKALAWQYVANPPTSFYGSEISGAQRLPNGNTLACEGTTPRFFEVTPDGQLVWSYVNPTGDKGPMAQGERATLDPKGHPQNAVFKIHWYAKDFAGFQGKDMTPAGTVETAETSCPADNANYRCTTAQDCTATQGADDSRRFTCAGGGAVCCFKLTQDSGGMPPKKDGGP